MGFPAKPCLSSVRMEVGKFVSLKLGNITKIFVFRAGSVMILNSGHCTSVCVCHVDAQDLGVEGEVLREGGDPRGIHTRSHGLEPRMRIRGSPMSRLRIMINVIRFSISSNSLYPARREI